MCFLVLMFPASGEQQAKLTASAHIAYQTWVTNRETEEGPQPGEVGLVRGIVSLFFSSN